MNKPMWHCRPFGDDGWVFIAVDQMLPSGTLVGLRHAVHPFTLDEALDPHGMFAMIVAELSQRLAVASAQPLITSRARAFGAREVVEVSTLESRKIFGSITLPDGRVLREP